MQNSKINEIRESLANVFDDDLDTNQWRNYADFLILSLIVISTIEIFLSTFDSIELKYGEFLRFIDIFTTIFFSVEVVLRIWTADLIDKKYSGFTGRIKYCFSFFGFIDIISTLPFFVNMVIPIDYTTFKMFRVLRLLRLFRYMKSFALLKKAALSKSSEMMVSFQFLLVMTILLAFSLFFVEHSAQPDKFSDGLDAFVWSFGQFAGDSGQYVVDNPPITKAGRIITYLLGILNIAIVAVPAGLLGSAFIDVIDEKKQEERLEENKKKLKYAFKREIDRYTDFRVVPLHVSVEDIQIKLQLSMEELLDIAHNSSNFRLCNMAKTVAREKRPHDKIVVENFYTNTGYGCKIDRGSDVTIVTTSSYDEPGMGNVAYYLSMMGGFNFVSKEAECNPLHHVSYYNIDKKLLVETEDAAPEKRSIFGKIVDLMERLNTPETIKKQQKRKQKEADERKKELDSLRTFVKDIVEVSRGKWVIFLLSTNGIYDSQIHFSTGVSTNNPQKGESTVDEVVFEKLYNSLAKELEEKHNLKSDCNQIVTCNESNIARVIGAPNSLNAFSIFVSYDVTCRNSEYLYIAQTMANVIKQNLYKDGVVNTDEMVEYGYGFPSEEDEE